MVYIKKYFLVLAAASALAACGGGEDTSAPSNAAPTATNVVLDGAKAWLPLHGTFKASDADGNPLALVEISEGNTVLTPQQGRYALKNGTLDVNGLDFVFTPLNSEATSFAYKVSDGRLNASAQVQIAAAVSDPLADQQWHLHNTGQKAYSMGDSVLQTLSKYFQTFFGMSAADADARAASQVDQAILKPGEDMNVMGAYAQGSTGQGTIAVVVDSGLELRHEDLAANILPNRSLNLVPGVVDPTDPTSMSTTGDHGTSVGGLIAAAGWNGLGGRGVAPAAQLIGINYLQEQSALSDMLGHGHPGSGMGVNDPVAVFNRSYGITIPTTIGYSEVDEAVQAYSATELRGGKGAVNMKAAGNSFEGADYEGSLCADNNANALGLPCYNANFEPSQATPYYFVVGAVNSNGKHTSYSTAGANLLVSAPAGEYGDTAPAMVTTDQSTCLRGYSSFAAQESYDAFVFEGFFQGMFPFNNPGHPDNLSCNYTSTFNGTSSATPNASGVVALILAANPALSYRDVRDILVRSSTQVDPTNAPVSLDTSDGQFLAHAGWVRNAAGFEFNNLYGFGRVNAGRAVQMAKAAALLPPAKMGAWHGQGIYADVPASLNLAVPDNSKAGAVMSFEVADDIKLEGVQFKFTISNPDYAYGFFTPQGYAQTTAGMDLAIEVVSPSGTRSVLLSSKQALFYPALTADFFDRPGYVLSDSLFLSNAFYGEPAKGTWTIRVLDVAGDSFASFGNFLGVDRFVNNTALSQVEGVAVRVFGH